ncbi:hypothetical protein ACT17Q_16115 [Cellulomonas sp. CW35]|uniref:hypothetical protein n=1 Tax=Cellulomonas TaxID=1707 RepID=UPI000ADDE83E|nr:MULTISPECIES: hypothetical protein [Cellulomonas]ASR56056.1 hypothetical protein CBP52_14210 [Cellulomonas sp. PSBB021]UJP40618.1 hypothetical protein F1D97_03685 [Cellulomonas palmilytica]
MSNPITYAPRHVRALPPVQAQGRTLKAYAMVAREQDRDRTPSAQWLREQASAAFGDPPGEGDHPWGFLIWHAGLQRDYLLVSQWFDADMLKHRVRGVHVDDEGRTTLAPLDEQDLVACVWELEVVAFERDAWVTNVLAAGRLDDETAAAYVGTTFSGWV